ncbi:MAG: Rne/Rng family ribonuclease [Myxococcales bacterium]|nr:Rne/Rng family ribonuclease [Myxococcales bacterium]
MGAVLVINVTGVETRVALVENGSISEYYLERKKDKGIVGNIYKGRVVRVLPGMQAAFVDIGLDKAAFLYVNDVFYDPDFSEQQFELTEGEHAELDDEIDEGLDLSAVTDVVTTAKAPTPALLEASAQPLVISVPALLGTPGDLKTPSVLNGSSTASPEPEAVASSCEAPVVEVSEIAASPASEVVIDAELVVEVEPDPEVIVPVVDAPPAAPSETAIEAEQATTISEPPLVAVAEESVAEASEEEGAAPEEGSSEASAETPERKGELCVRSRRRRRGGTARRELRHSEQPADHKSPEAAATMPEAVSGEATVDSNPVLETTVKAVELAAPEEGEKAAPAEAPENVEAVETAEPVQATPIESEAVEPAAPVTTDAATSVDEPPPVEAAANASDDKAAAVAAAAVADTENTPVVEQQRGNQRQGKQGERGSRRGGARHERGDRNGNGANGAEVRAADKHANANANADADADSDNGKSKKQRPVANIQDLLKVGQEIIVQVAKDPIGTKGARVTSHISIPGRQIVFMPTVDHVGISRRIEKESERRRLREIVERIRPPGTGFIVRTVAENISTEKLEADARFLIGIWSEVVAKRDKVGAPALLHPDLDLTLRATRDLFVQDVEKLVIDDRAEWERISRFVAAQAPALKDRVVLHEGDEPIFDAYGIEHELQRAYGRKVWLKSGGYLIIDQAEALTAIDVNSGRYVGKKSLEETITRINIEAAKEIVYQLRLRNIGGIMIIDFIDMAKAQNRDKVFKALQEALGRDKARTNILKISELGLIEMTRKRVRESLGRTLNEPCPHCDGRGHVKSKTTIAYEIFREIRREANNYKEGSIIVNCHPEVARILQVEEREELRYLMDRFNKTIQVRQQPSYQQEQFDIYGKTERQGRSRGGDREQGSSNKLTNDRAPLRKPSEPSADRKPLEPPPGRLSEYPPEKEKSGGNQQ